ncbi:hypothetical protein A2572_00260 [Candidatus Collierbacteria bacterium RIFOXYD1_FULL_40_9]|uniref:NYN domain-containing protein n=1 Tax=Candidatus Collierbacteria bacterium RIFOXYD1_FULL_40_9 TaxID=1817731 RepID=A0A1F5FV97_9BACT|nr:MAG: hypothetical protein A2572_00260 [Candidatus Collierbacteria bacterium RIFOXYD1_FULL_40_9]
MKKLKKLDSGSRSGMTRRGNYAFIDSQNLNLGVKSQKWTLDYGRFRKYLADKYGVTKAYMFIGYVAGNQQLYKYLQEAGFLLIFKPVLEYKDKKSKEMVIKGNVDAELVLHSMIEFLNYDKAVIVTGDGDFFCLVEYLEKQNKLKKIVVPSPKYSSLLRKYGSYIVSLSLLKEKLKYSSARSGLSTKKRGIP